MFSVGKFRECIVEMIRLAETRLPSDIVLAIERGKSDERNKIAELQFENMLKNLKLARKLGAPICQDTGIFTFFIRVGDKLKLDFDIMKELGNAVETAVKEIPLRTNIVDPLSRKQVARAKWQPIVHLEPVRGKEFRVDLLVKGAGADNCSRIHMLKPTDGEEAIKRVVLKTIEEAGGKPCPPTVVGVGVGGSAGRACLLAEKALLRPLDERNSDVYLTKLEREISLAANKLGIGPMGLGGRTTVLGVRVVKAACHTASLPVAVSFQCWAARRASAKLSNKDIVIEVP